MAGYIGNKAVNLSTSGADISGTANLDIIDVDGAANFAADVTFADGADIITASAGTSNFRAGVNAGNSIASGGNYNTVVGDEAGTAITTGDQNVAIGYGAASALSTGANIVAIGYLAGNAITTGENNIAIGKNALGAEDTHDFNIAIGSNALAVQNAGADAYNIAIGHNAGTAVTTGVQHTIIGGLAGDALTDSGPVVAVGYEALSTEDRDGFGTTAIGYQALKNQNAGASAYNTGVGWNAGLSVTTGILNTLIGGLAGDALTDADHNVAIGYQALTTDTLGSRAVAIGREALGTQNFTSATDNYNIAIGYQAGKAVTTGTRNTFVGGLAGDATDNGLANTAVGYIALSANCGDQNTAIGDNALAACTGATNTALGQAAGVSVTSGGNNVIIGADAGRASSPGGNITTGSNIITLGNNSTATANIKVDWTVSSDQRDKTDFTALDLGLSFVNALNPVTYKWDERSDYGDKTADNWSLSDQTPDGTHKKDWLDVGFKAQEVEALEQAAGYNKSNKTNLTVSLSPDGEQYGMKYSKFVPILVKALQELSAKNDALEARIATLEG